MINQDQINRLLEIFRSKLTWLVWRLMGNKYVSQQDIANLKKQKLLPMNAQIEANELAFVFGKLEAVLKKAEWRNLSWEDVLKAAKTRQSDIQQLQIQSSELSTFSVIRGLVEDIQKGLFDSLSDFTQKPVTEGVIRNIIGDVVKEGVESRENYKVVGDRLATLLNERKRLWRRVALTEMHTARQAGVVNAIVSGVDVYKYSEKEESNVAVQVTGGACEDCRRIYLNPETGHPKFFKIKELLSNSGSNYIRPWRKNAKPVVPPLHPNCVCFIRYVPPGYDWDAKGRLVMSDKASIKVEKSLEILRKSQPSEKENYTLLQESIDDIQIPTEDEIMSLKTVDDALEVSGRLQKLADMHTDDYDSYKNLRRLSMRALYRAYVLKNGGFVGESFDE